MSELKIPYEAYDAACQSMLVEVGSAAGLRYCAAVDAAAPLIVAAELRRLAKEQLKTHDDISCMSLLRRADELDPQGVTK